MTSQQKELTSLINLIEGKCVTTFANFRNQIESDNQIKKQEECTIKFKQYCEERGIDDTPEETSIDPIDYYDEYNVSSSDFI